jgi:hypothetical protein
MPYADAALMPLMPFRHSFITPPHSMMPADAIHRQPLSPSRLLMPPP